jgi:uncharacterized protein YjbJ (UPF0337 family)
MLDQQTKQHIEQNWQYIKPQIKQAFPQVTDDDLNKTKGQADQIVSVIEKKTGTPTTQVEQKLQQFV